MSNPIIGPNPLNPDLLSPDDQAAEFQQIMVAGLSRMSSANAQQNSVPIALPNSISKSQQVAPAPAGSADSTERRADPILSPEPRKPDALLTQDELANRWQVSARTLERWRWTGIGPRFLKIGRIVRYRLEDIEAYEKQRLTDCS